MGRYIQNLHHILSFTHLAVLGRVITFQPGCDTFLCPNMQTTRTSDVNVECRLANCFRIDFVEIICSAGVCHNSPCSKQNLSWKIALLFWSKTSLKETVVKNRSWSWSSPPPHPKRAGWFPKSPNCHSKVSSKCIIWQIKAQNGPDLKVSCIRSFLQVIGEGGWTSKNPNPNGWNPKSKNAFHRPKNIQ